MLSVAVILGPALLWGWVGAEWLRVCRKRGWRQPAGVFGVLVTMALAALSAATLSVIVA